MTAALTALHEAMECLERDPSADRSLQANVLEFLARLSAETPDTSRSAAVQRWMAAADWSGRELIRKHLWTAVHCSVLSELTGNVDDALSWASRAERCDDDAAHRALGLTRLAAVFRGAGERRAQREFALRAAAVYQTVAHRTRTHVQARILFHVAEELLAAEVPQECSRQFIDHVSCAASVPSVLQGDAALHALKSSVDAAIYESRGDNGSAVRSRAEAFAAYRAMRYGRLASIAALQLARSTGEAHYAEFATCALRSCPTYWVSLEVSAEPRPQMPALTAYQRTILGLVAEGKTYKEIAATLGRSWRTVNNNVEHLRTKFGAANRGELVAEAIRLGAVAVAAPNGASRTA